MIIGRFFLLGGSGVPCGEILTHSPRAQYTSRPHCEPSVPTQLVQALNICITSTPSKHPLCKPRFTPTDPSEQDVGCSGNTFKGYPRWGGNIPLSLHYNMTWILVRITSYLATITIGVMLLMVRYCPSVPAFLYARVRSIQAYLTFTRDGENGS